MWRRLKTRGFAASQAVVGLILRMLSPTMVEVRTRRRLHRRQYTNPGPNFCWHIDGYDKLKPYGFAIHGAMDGFSRRIMWLEVGITNNNPQVTALYFARAVEEVKKIPCIVRCDRGTENVHIERIQKFWRRSGTDMFAGNNSFVYGRSTANQRIESWWAMLRRQCTNSWMNMFKDMQTLGLLNVQDKVHIECLRFCFMDLLQGDLEIMRDEWNTHHISTKRQTQGVSGKPDKMYFLPEEFEAQDYATTASLDEVQPIVETLEHEDCNQPVSKEFVQFANSVCPGLEMPRNVSEAKVLFAFIVQKVSEIDSSTQ